MKWSNEMSDSLRLMRAVRAISQCRWIVLLLLLVGSALSAQTASAQTEQHRIRNIVLVHGAWADGSGWKGVYDILAKDGFNVSIVQEPETSFQEDVAATKRVLAQQDGPCILVAHSYGGAVITEAGTDPSVAGLVYIAAHMPDAGENEADDGKRFPSDLSKSTVIKKTADGFTYLDPAQFHEYFAADVSADQAAFMARSQVMNAANSFKAVITTAAWRSKPSWALIAGSDRAISPDLERWYATRANSHKAEVPGASHAVYVSRPKEVAALIEEAASQALQKASVDADDGGLLRVGLRSYQFTVRESGEISMTNQGNGIIGKPSNHSVEETVEKLKNILQAKGVTLFALVDHSGEAAKVGMKMPPTKLLIFGSPKAGTPLMLAAPSIAIDLPLKILVSEDAQGKVWISYNSAAYLQERHNLPADLLQNIAVVESLAAKASE